MSRKIFYTTAIVIVIAAAIIVKALPGHFYKTGENYYKQSNYMEAYKNFANAKRLAPTNKDYRYYYVLLSGTFKTNNQGAERNVCNCS